MCEKSSVPQEVANNEVRDARMQVLLSDKVAQANLEMAEAVEKGEVVIGGSK